MKPELDLDAILAVADGYEERKKKARGWHVQNDIAADEDHLQRIATFRTDEAVKAFEALRPLVARVRELERQREYLAFELSTDDDQADCNHTHLSCEHRKGWLCKAGKKGQMQCWISEAEKVAKEAGE